MDLSIPCGYYQLDVLCIPPLLAKTPVGHVSHHACQTHMHIRSAHAFTLCSPYATQSVPPGEYFIWNVGHTQWQIETISGTMHVFENCILPETYAFLHTYPYIQLGNWDIYYYWGEVVPTKAYWETQIHYPLQYMPSLFKETPYWVSHLHGPPEQIRQLQKDAYLKRTLDMTQLPTVGETDILRLVYRRSVLKYIEAHFKKNYNLSIAALTHDAGLTAKSFDEYTTTLRAEHPHNRPDLPGVMFITVGSFVWDKSQYEKRLHQTGLV